jgi:hypothetical protein
MVYLEHGERSTLFPHKDTGKVSWVSPEHRIQNQTDYIAVSNKWRTFIARIFRSNVKSVLPRGCKTSNVMKRITSDMHT